MDKIEAHNQSEQLPQDLELTKEELTALYVLAGDLAIPKGAMVGEVTYSTGRGKITFPNVPRDSKHVTALHRSTYELIKSHPEEDPQITFEDLNLTPEDYADIAEILGSKEPYGNEEAQIRGDLLAELRLKINALAIPHYMQRYELEYRDSENLNGPGFYDLAVAQGTYDRVRRFQDSLIEFIEKNRYVTELYGSPDNIPGIDILKEELYRF